MEKNIFLHGAAALATVVLYKLLGGEDTTWVAAVVCMYLWWLVTLADVEDLKILKVQIAVDGSFANGVRFGIELALRILKLEDDL